MESICFVDSWAFNMPIPNRVILNKLFILFRLIKNNV
jgi:hypothetical protein